MQLNFNKILKYYLNLIEKNSERIIDLYDKENKDLPSVRKLYEIVREHIENLPLDYYQIDDEKLAMLIINFSTKSINYKTLNDLEWKVNWLLLKSFGEKYDGF